MGDESVVQCLVLIGAIHRRLAIQRDGLTWDFREIDCMYQTDCSMQRSHVIAVLVVLGCTPANRMSCHDSVSNSVLLYFVLGRR